MKKFIGLALVSALSLSVLAGCGGSSKSTDASKEATYKDGKYRASFDRLDTHGWNAFTEIEIKDGKIATVDFDYLNKDNKRKSEDADYIKAMASKSGTSPDKYCPQLEKALIDKQDLEKVDGVTGATNSTNNMKQLAKLALENAKKGDYNEVIVPQPDVKEEKK
ncbi:FMN-binding protein [Clostridium sp. HMP27]|uniref:FMN-binding protein n=1 Tax=Clostridium sp. HMP27 TaxID=1487921 RepID=UPI00068B3F9E|nr:FMN-binding protein [Clostridium sp. HMP27]